MGRAARSIDVLSLHHHRLLLLLLLHLVGDLRTVDLHRVKLCGSLRRSSVALGFGGARWRAWTTGFVDGHVLLHLRHAELLKDALQLVARVGGGKARSARRIWKPAGRQLGGAVCDDAILRVARVDGRFHRESRLLTTSHAALLAGRTNKTWGAHAYALRAGPLNRRPRTP